jgi:hypothetical protein
MDAPVDQTQLPQALIDTLLESKAAVARGDIGPMAPVLDRMRATIARMEARQASVPNGT